MQAVHQLFDTRRLFAIIAIATLLITTSESCSKKKIPPMPENSVTQVEVYVSSQAGDRLTKKENTSFILETNTSLPTIIVDEKKVYQTIEGFGASFNEAGMICLNDLPSIARDSVFRSLFDSAKGSGFTLMKAPIAACDFASAGPWYSYNETPDDTLMTHFSIARDLGNNGLVTYIKKALGYGTFKIESPMDFAPDWMYYSLQPGEKHIKPQYYNALALYYAKYLAAYAAQGIRIDYLNLFNEADNSGYSDVTYHEIAELIKKHVVPRFKAEGVSVKIQFGETAYRGEALEKFPVELNDAELRTHLNSLTVHGYDWDQFAKLTELHNKYPDLPIWLTEICYAQNLIPPGGPSQLPAYEFSDGELWGNMIINDLKNWVSAWIYWNMILDESGGPWLVATEHGDPENNIQHPVVIINRTTKKVSYTGLYYYLSHFSKFVRPGARRIDCTGGSAQLNFVGFQNTDGSIVLNVINNGEGIDGSIAWNNKFSTQKFPGHSITTLKWRN